MQPYKTTSLGVYLLTGLIRLFSLRPCVLAFSSSSCLRVFMFIISLSLCAPMMNTSAQTQKPWQWVKQLGGNGWDVAGGIAHDSKNNIYLTGSFFSTLQGPGAKAKSFGNQDIYLARFDEKGNLKDLWTGGGHAADQASCIAVSPTDQVIIGGSVTDTISLGKLNDAAPGRRLFLCSLTPKGQFAWIKSFSGEGTASLSAIATDRKGTIYALGAFTGKLTAGNISITSSGKNDLFLARFSSVGAIEKLIGFGGEEDDLAGALAVNDSGMVSCSGQCGKTFKAGEYTLPGSGRNPRGNAFLLGFDPSLSPAWAHTFTGEEYCQLSSLSFDSQNNLYACGSFSFTLKTDDTTFVSKGYTDALVLKYSQKGQLLWGRSTGSWYYDYAYQVISDPIDGAVVTGALGDTLSVDSLTITPVSQQNSALILQFSPKGTVSWGDCISGNGRNFSTGATLDSWGNLYMAGSFRNVFEKEGEEITSRGDQDVFLAKYFNCLTSQGEIFGQPALCPGLPTTLSIKSGFKRVVWNDSIKNTNYIEAYKPGLYRVSMYDKKGCRQTDSVEVTVVPSPGSLVGPDTSLWVSDSILLQVKGSFDQYRWNDRSSDNSYLAMAQDGKPGSYSYWVSVTDSLNCTWGDTITITYKPIPDYTDLSKAQLISYPNPATEAVYWYLNTENPCRLVVELADEHGRIHQVESLEVYVPGEVRKINLSNQPMGPYYIRVKNPGGTGTIKTLRIIKR